MKSPQLPFPKLSEALGIPNEVWFKREDLHKYGSHKGRAIPFMIDEYKKQGITNFIVSSSGNAALAAIRAVQSHNRNSKGPSLSLQIFVGNKIDSKKLLGLKKEIADTHITLEQVDNPKQTAFQKNKNGDGKWLRQSTDDLALMGYAELAKELSKIENLAAVFVPTSSGTTAQGLYQGFQELGISPQLHIVQTTSCHPIVDVLEAISYKLKAKSSTSSLATAIVDTIALRKEPVAAAIKNSQGSGWIATNEEILSAQKLTKEATGIDLSPNSALATVGLEQAIKAGWKWEGAVVCLITGR
ncbi:MAG TPA: PLP-dependent lyase/thiolase [Patescibacteria group bacterium]|nr:PLP-dependent lyase/thiolase [Patescibacteria group bacterium]